MSSPVSGPTPIGVQANQVTVFSVKDGVARVRFGGEYWDVSILKLDVDPVSGSTVTDPKYHMTQEIAQRVQQAFASMIGNPIQASDTAVTIKGTLTESTASGGAASIAFTTMDKTDAAGTTANVSITGNTIITGLGAFLAEKHAVLTTPPAPPTPSPASSTNPAAGATTASAATTPSSGDLSDNVTVDGLQEQFATRDKTAISNPFDAVALTGDDAAELKKNFANHITKFGDWLGLVKGNQYDEGAKFDAILKELKHINLKDPNTLRTSGVKEFSIDGEFGNVLIKAIGALTKDEKQKLVKVYADYLNTATSTTHYTEGFYKMWLEARASDGFKSPAFDRVVILKENAQGKLEVESNSTHDTSTKDKTITDSQRTIFLFKKSDGSFEKYERKKGTPPSKLLALDAITSSSLQSNTTSEIYVRDVGGGGRCADRSLADQILNSHSLQHSDANKHAENLTKISTQLRAQAATRIREQEFQNDDNNILAVKTSVKDMIDNRNHPNLTTISSLKAISESIIPTNESISDITFDAINNLAKDGFGGNIFDRLKGKIHNAKYPSGNPGSPDTDFGGQCLRLAKGESVTFDGGETCTQSDATQYIKEGLQALKLELKQEITELKAIAEKTDDLTPDEKNNLCLKYADAIEKDPTTFLDNAFFLALSQIDLNFTDLNQNASTNYTIAGQKYSISILRSDATSKLRHHQTFNPTGQAFDKDKTLAIHHDSANGGHYRSVVKNSSSWRNLTIPF